MSEQYYTHYLLSGKFNHLTARGSSGRVVPRAQPEGLPCILHTHLPPIHPHPDPGDRLLLLTHSMEVPAAEDIVFPPSNMLRGCFQQADGTSLHSRPVANANARARGIPGAVEASPSCALSSRVLQASARGQPGREGGLHGVRETGQKAAATCTSHLFYAGNCQDTQRPQRGPGAGGPPSRPCRPNPVLQTAAWCQVICHQRVSTG